MNPWIIHVKQYAKKKNMPYGCALSDHNCAKEYKMNKEKPKEDETVTIRKGLIKLLKKNKIYYEDNDSIETLRRRYHVGK